MSEDCKRAVAAQHVLHGPCRSGVIVSISSMWHSSSQKRLQAGQVLVKQNFAFEGARRGQTSSLLPYADLLLPCEQHCHDMHGLHMPCRLFQEMPTDAAERWLAATCDGTTVVKARPNRCNSHRRTMLAGQGPDNHMSVTCDARMLIGPDAPVLLSGVAAVIG